MNTRLASLLIRSVCVAAVVFGMSAPSSACWFPFCWHSHATYRPAYYGPVYAPSCGSACSPCGAGGCGVQTYYGAVGCSPCGVCNPCNPCGNCSACGSGCAVSYAPDAGPIPDSGADAAGTNRQTFADESATETGSEETPDDDFGPVEREEPESTGTDPFPEIDRPLRPAGPSDDEEADPQPLNLEGEGITLRVTPARQRIHAEARYRVPRIVRLEVQPGSPWQPTPELPAQVASK